MLVGELEISIRVHLATQADLQRVTFFDQSFLDRIFDGRAVGVWAAEVAAPSVAMRVQLEESHGAKLLVDGAQDGQQNRMISAYTDRPRTGSENLAQLFRNATISVFYREWVDGEIAKISDPPLLERIDFQHRIPRPDHGRLNSNVAWSKTRTGTVSSAPIERNAY